jgi:hypothetical protein
LGNLLFAQKVTQVGDTKLISASPKKPIRPRQIFYFQSITKTPPTASHPGSTNSLTQFNCLSPPNSMAQKTAAEAL